MPSGFLPGSGVSGSKEMKRESPAGPRQNLLLPRNRRRLGVVNLEYFGQVRQFENFSRDGTQPE
jgi:hypothetical protein